MIIKAGRPPKLGRLIFIVSPRQHKNAALKERGGRRKRIGIFIF
jgi:hypothetical protein